MRAKRRRPFAIAAATFLSLGGAVTLSIAASPDANIVQAAVTRAQSLADLLNQRSPGARTEGRLTKIKRARQALAGEPTEFTLLSRKRSAASTPMPQAKSLEAILAAPAFPIPDMPIAVLDIDPLPSLNSFPPIPPGSGVVAPTEGPGSPRSNPSLAPEPLVTAAVPEPATWAMMIVGFGLIGWRLRRKRPSSLKTVRG